ncbi:MAG TPA: hypothetical protein VK658_07725 [Chryseolinea sp.]|nr:hypothetical protein [Chryseolinea sp.]
MRKIYQYSALTLFAAIASVSSCKDEDRVIVPEWESGVHGLGEFNANTDDVNFIKGDPSIDLTIDLLWNSIDHQNEVTKIDLYLAFNEAYTDQDGNPKTAKHGGDQGVLYKTYEGSNIPADKAPTTFTISQDDVFALYDGDSFNYYGTGELPIWGGGSIRDDRDTEAFKFVDGDAFQLKWVFTTADGRVFDKWGVSVCTEFPGANCSVNWAAVCAQDIKEPAGDWTINMTDLYGDGWNGAAVKVIVDGVATDYTLDDGDSGVTVVTVPDGTEILTFEFVSGDWDSEVVFNIKSPKGNTIADEGPSPGEGVLTLNLCSE